MFTRSASNNQRTCNLHVFVISIILALHVFKSYSLLSSSGQHFNNLHRRTTRFPSHLTMAKKSKSTSATEKKHDVTIHWFRNGLRLHDNPCLLDACSQSSSILPLYVIDPDAPFAQTAGRKAGAIRANFILESIQEINLKLEKHDSKLVVVLGKPHIVIPKIVKEVQANAIYYEREPAAPVRESDALVLDGINTEDVDIVGYDTHTLHSMEHYLAHCKDHVAPNTYGVFTKMFNKLSVPEEVPDCDLETFPPLPSSLDKFKSTADCDVTNECPSLKDLGYDKKEIKNRHKSGIKFVGGEDAGLALLDKMMARTQWVSTFEKPKTSPNALKVDTTGLSACKYVC